MTNAEYYKNRSLNEMLEIFQKISPNATTDQLSNWLKSQHISVKVGDVICRTYMESQLDIVTSVNFATERITIQDIARYLTHSKYYETIPFIELDLFTGKPIFNINDLQQDTSGKSGYHFVAKHSYPIISSLDKKVVENHDKPRSRKGRIICYMRDVMKIDAKYINELQGLSVKDISSRFTDVRVQPHMRIFNFLYNISGSRENVALSDSFKTACRVIASDWLNARQHCYDHAYIECYELN